MAETYRDAIKRSLDKVEICGKLTRTICFGEFITSMGHIVEHLSACIPYRDVTIGGQDGSEFAHRAALFMSVDQFIDWLLEKPAGYGWFSDEAIIDLFNEWASEEDTDER